MHLLILSFAEEHILNSELVSSLQSLLIAKLIIHIEKLLLLLVDVLFQLNLLKDSQQPALHMYSGLYQ